MKVDIQLKLRKPWLNTFKLEFINFIWKYLRIILKWDNASGESKVLQYFGHVRHNSAAPDAFARSVKGINPIGLRCRARLILFECYSPDLSPKPRINTFRLTRSFLVVAVLAIREKRLKPSGYCTVIDCTFTIQRTNVFGCFQSVMAQFKLVQHKFPN